MALRDTIYRSLYIQTRGVLRKELQKHLAAHKRLSMEIDMAICFCDPGSPWRRVANENTNRLLQQ